MNEPSAPIDPALAEMYSDLTGNIGILAGGAGARASMKAAGAAAPAVNKGATLIRKGAEAGKMAVERGAARAGQTLIDPKGGFVKGFIAGFGKEFFAGDAAFNLPGNNFAFDRGAAFGGAIGTFLAPISRALLGGP
jgi:hypothetical protein